MFVDLFTQVSAAQSLTSGTTISTNVIDMSAIDPDWGIGEPVGFAITVDVAADVADADETYQVNIVGDDAAALSSVVVLSEMLMLRDTLIAGFKWFMPLPGGVATERYIGLQYILGQTTPTVTLSAHFCPQSMAEHVNRHHASGFTVS